MKLQCVIRKYQSEDREHCRKLWKELTEWHREIYDDPTIGGEHPEDYFDEHLAKVGSDRFWVAVHDSEIVGLMGIIAEKEEAEIEPLIVSRSYRGKRLGEMLIKEAISEARRNGSRYLNINPVARNVQAIRFFHKQGFRNLGHIQLFLDLSSCTWKPGLKLHDREFSF